MDDNSVISDVPVHLRRQKRMFTFLTSKNVPPVPHDDERKSYKGNNIWRNLGFFWVFPLIRLGYKRTLQPQDLFYLPEDLQINEVYGKFEQNFEKYNEAAKLSYLKLKCKSRGESLDTSSVDPQVDLLDYQVSLLTASKALFMTFKWQYSFALVAFSLSDVATLLSALLTKSLVQYVSLKAAGIEEGIGKGVGYALGLSFLLFVGFVLANTCFYYSTVTGNQVRALLTKAILNKSFKANSKSRHDYPASKLTSFANGDTSKLEICIATLPILTTFPVTITVSIVLLAINLGITLLVSLGVIIFFMVIFVFVVKAMIGHRQKSLKFTDMRVNFTKEIVNYLKIIKLYSWEDSYYEKVSDIRTKEAKHLISLQFFRSILFVAAISLSPVTSMVTFLVLYAVDSGKRTAANIFSSLTLIDLLGNTFTTLPMVIGTTVDGAVAIKRIFGFLGSSEIEQDDYIEINEDALPLDTDPNQTVIDMRDVTFFWETFPDEIKDEKKQKPSISQKLKTKFKKNGTIEAEKIEPLEDNAGDAASNAASDRSIPSTPQYFKLKNINLKIQKGEFIMITGVVGSGKSSLLSALSGQMKRESGSMEVNGSSVLCGIPWVQNATIKENIIFGKPYDEKNYAQAVFACALNDDLRAFPAGERTEVGERGITLSGGQKARLSLARAIYAQKDIILLDDVLSAVDARVGKHIMELGMLGMLKEKTRILATHQLSFLDYADKVVFINEDGTIDCGTVDELSRRNSAFVNLMDHKDRDDKSENEEEQNDSASSGGSGNDIQGKEQDEIWQDDDYLKTDGKLIEKENSAENSVGWGVYKTLLQLGTGRINSGLFLIIMVIGSILPVFSHLFTNTWLSFWVDYKFDDLNDGSYIGVYVILSLSSIIFTLFEFTLFVQLIVNASKLLNIKAIGSILHVPMSYMDTTPTGRILNRFTKDTDAVDNQLVENVKVSVFMVTAIIGIFILAIIYLPWLAIAFPIVLIMTLYVGSYFQASSRELKRLELVQRSLVLNNFSECLSGIDVIKSYAATDRFLKTSDKFLDKSNEAGFLVVAIQRWGGFQMNVLATSFIILVSLLCVGKVFDISPASVGLVISYVVPIPSLLSTGIRTIALVDNDMTSFERIHEYANELPQEASYHRNDTAPPPGWPSKGAITFDNASLRYREGLPKVMKNITLEIRPNERIGICGRTGAGKSTITSSLFRLVELCEGSISIDGIEISHLGMNELRSKLSIIPQESVLFGGTIRKNLDPFEVSDDETLWDALRRAGLIEASSLEEVKRQTENSKEMHKFHLLNTVETDGTNFSLGERQLIAFARALVRNSKILVLDEATSSVDYATDSKIQQTIAKEFNNCTILSIAHRLRTIINYDKILVLDEGEVKEFDTPLNLFNDESSIFHQLCEKSKIKEEDFSQNN